MKKMIYICVISLALTFSAGPVFAEKRCDGEIISKGKLMYITEKKCGPPLSKERVGEVRYDGEDNNVERIIYLTELVYSYGGGHYVLTFEGSRLIKSEFIK